MIKIDNIKKSYQMGDTVVKALDGVTLSIAQGEFIAIMGPSGSGKSTLMHILGMLDMPESGSYELNGVSTAQLSDDDLAALRSRSIGFVFQQFNLLARTSAAENVGLPMIYAGKDYEHERALTVLRLVGLADRSEHRPNEMSGGQQQRVAIARALVNQPLLILADEPTGNLDSASEQEIMGMLRELNATGITVVIVTHEPEIGQQMRRVIRMRDGKIQSDERLKPEPQRAPSLLSSPSLTSPLAGKALYAKRWLAMITHLRQAMRALLANKVRSLLSMLGILIGVAAIIAMLALGTGARESIEAQLSSLGSNLLVLRASGTRAGGVSLGAGSGTKLSLEDAEAIKAQVSGISHVAANLNGRAQVTFADRNWNTLVTAVGIEYPIMRNAIPIVGRFFSAEENEQRARVAVIGATVIRELFGDKNPLGEIIKINRISFQVIGILPVKGSSGFQDQDDAVIVPVNTGMRRLFGKHYVEGIDIEVKSPELMRAVQDDVTELMNKRHRVRDPENGPFQIRNMADIQEAVSSTSRVLSMLLAAIASISLLVGGVGIMNIMLVSVTERTREIGLRKAIGATRRSIKSQFLVEALLISSIGGGLGIGLGALIALTLSEVAGWATRISPQSMILAAGFSAGVGIIFGYWPARKASGLHPIEALRYE